MICNEIRDGDLNGLLVLSRFTVNKELIMVFSLVAYSAITSAPDVKSRGVGGK